MLFTNETDDFFNEELARLRKDLVSTIYADQSLKIPKEFWDYVYQLERCLALHYKPPGGIRHKFHGGIKQWRDALYHQDLPWYGAKKDS